MSTIGTFSENPAPFPVSSLSASGHVVSGADDRILIPSEAAWAGKQDVARYLGVSSCAIQWGSRYVSLYGSNVCYAPGSVGQNPALHRFKGVDAFLIGRILVHLHARL